MRIDVLTLFPDFIRQTLAFGVLGRACERGLVQVETWNPRDHAEGGYRRVDDRPFGGGPGMVMLIEPLARALAAARAADPRPLHVIHLSPQGRRLDQARVRELARMPRLALVCSRYEGVDERFIEQQVDEELSLGDYVISGGELGAAVLIDAIARLQPGALGDAESAAQDSFEHGLLDCPHYSKPARHAWGDVPEVLLSGNHAEIERWRRRQSLLRTAQRRPDLIAAAHLDPAEREWLAQALPAAESPPSPAE
ncbi:tRNA (guanosine(37)-N1)-methyltransferase TrmD [Luteimonas sp. e5]